MIAKMKRIIIATALLAIGTVSCSSCAKKTPDPVVPDAAPSATVTPVPPTPVPSTVLIKQANWEFTLPSEGWQKVGNPPPGSVALINNNLRNIIILVSEPFKGSSEEYSLIALRGIKDAGATIVSAKQTDINGHKFVLVESFKGNIKVWMWVSLINGQGYGFSCGGPDSPSPQDLCFGIANTLKIN